MEDTLGRLKAIRPPRAMSIHIGLCYNHDAGILEFDSDNGVESVL